ncbi:MAG: VTT domain-containing protein [Deltaproteobacteria bacterium]|nr:VTT domain-containing protein [Deltaproteobacteria bacterium]
MAMGLQTGNSYRILLRISSIVGALASAGLMIWILMQHWQTFMAWKAEAGFWPFFAGLAVIPLFGFPVTPLLVLAGATFELLPALAGCALAFGVNLTLSHLLARRYLRNWLTRMANHWQYEIPGVGSRSRLTVLFLVRITPGPPMAFKNYVGALVEAPFTAYIAIYWTATMLYALGLLALGDSLSNASMPEGAAAIALLGAMLMLVLWTLKRLGGLWRNQLSQERSERFPIDKTDATDNRMNIP